MQAYLLKLKYDKNIGMRSEYIQYQNLLSRL